MAQLAMGEQGMFVGFCCSAQRACGYMLLLCQEQGGSRAQLGSKIIIMIVIIIIKPTIEYFNENSAYLCAL